MPQQPLLVFTTPLRRCINRYYTRILVAQLVVVLYQCGAFPGDNTGTKVGPRTIPEYDSMLLFIVLYRTGKVATSDYDRTKLGQRTERVRH